LTEPLQVLLVEDNPTDALLLVQAFSEVPQLEVELTHVDRLSAACDALHSRKPDVVLLDLGLPDSTGVETFIQLQPHAANVPTLVLTGLNDERVGLRTIKEGAQDFLVKANLSPQILGQAVRYAIERANFQRSVAEMHQEIRLLNTDLERRVKLRTHELEIANQEGVAFSYGGSHELAAPLGGRSFFSEMLARDLGERVSPEAAGYLQRVQEAAHRMRALIEDLLLLSRVSRVDLRLDPVDLSELAADVWARLEGMEPGRAVRFQVAPDLQVCGDTKLLRIALENVLGNARKFTRKTPDAQVELGAESKDVERVFYVRDNGAGFDMKQAQELFVPFKRLHSVEEFPGTGIGLATVRRVVERHGGRIWAEAEPGQGAVFYFTLEASVASPS